MHTRSAPLSSMFKGPQCQIYVQGKALGVGKRRLKTELKKWEKLKNKAKRPVMKHDVQVRKFCLLKNNHIFVESKNALKSGYRRVQVKRRQMPSQSGS